MLIGLRVDFHGRSVGLSVGNDPVFWKNRWGDWVADWSGGSDASKEPLSEIIQIPHGKGQFWMEMGQRNVTYRRMQLWRRSLSQISLVFLVMGCVRTYDIDYGNFKV